MDKPYSAFAKMAQEIDGWLGNEGKPIFDIGVEAVRGILRVLPEPWLEIGIDNGRIARALEISTTISMDKWYDGLFDKESFGTVFLIGTLCFIDSPLDFLREASHVIMNGGKMVLGMVFEDSPWGQMLQRMKEEKHPVLRHAMIYRCNEVTQLTVDAGLVGEIMVSTLLQKPGEVKQMEEPRGGYYQKGGFTIIVVGKTGSDIRE